MAEAKTSSVKSMVLPPLVLALICAVCCAFLALANMVTKDKIAAAEADAIQTSLKQLPDAGTFEEVTDFQPENNEKASATGLYLDENGQYAVLVTADGYNKAACRSSSAWTRAEPLPAFPLSPFRKPPDWAQRCSPIRNCW